MINNNHSLCSILDANELTGSNFLDCYKNLRIILKQENRLYVFERAKPSIPAIDAFEEVLNEHIHHADDDEQTTCVMLASMSPELRRQHENMGSQTIILHLKELFDSKYRNERYEISREFFRCKMTEGSSVNIDILKMINYIEKLG
ncbi:hypothetical protein P3X46_018261 [Hevea brasiliensis]|uniref:Uncharacterized protein n=1 Tax=Hevea brasiliensis TaxID=3981 RepID=A0ABQ9LRH1_HEVBR|nr:hypothetical protein P3X46_018261 [Hevea brasiliensis]